jgi:hypothetical protein
MLWLCQHRTERSARNVGDPAGQRREPPPVAWWRTGRHMSSLAVSQGAFTSGVSNRAALPLALLEAMLAERDEAKDTVWGAFEADYPRGCRWAEPRDPREGRTRRPSSALAADLSCVS